MKLLFLRKYPSETVLIVVLFTAGLVSLPSREIGALFFADEMKASLMGMFVCRTLSAALALFCMLNMGLGASLLPRGRRTLRTFCALCALAVCVNNLPIIALARGTAGVTADFGTVALFAAECLSVAAFEEIAFRGMVLPLLCECFERQKHGTMSAVVLSSVLFGGMHLLNLSAGGAAGATVLQVGYSALIGGMLAVVLLAGGSLPLCILLHAVYNVCGLIVPALGFGAFRDIWNAPTVAISAALGVAVFCAFSALLFCMRKDRSLYALPPRARFLMFVFSARRF